MDEELKNMATLRAKIADKLASEIESNMFVKTTPWLSDWTKRILDEVEIGKQSPMQGLHCYLRKVTLAKRDASWNSEWNMIPFIKDWLGDESFPPRPKQTRIGIRAARWSRMTTFFGPSGTGKTTCAVRAIQYMASTRSLDGLITVSGERLAMMGSKEILDMMEASTHAEVMLIDDIDKGITGANVRKVASILEILKIREMAKYHRTIVTTNKCGAELVDLIDGSGESNGNGVPLVNRLRRGVCIDFGPTDFDEDLVDMEVRNLISRKKKGSGEEDEFDSEYGFLAWRNGL